MEIFSRWNEVCLAIVALIWGAILVMPGDLFIKIDRYRMIGQYFPDWVWGILFLIGSMGILIVPSIGIRKQLHAFMSALWVGIIVLALLTPFNIGTLLIVSLCWLAMMVHVGKFFRISLIQRLTRDEKL